MNVALLVERLEQSKATFAQKHVVDSMIQKSIVNLITIIGWGLASFLALFIAAGFVRAAQFHSPSYPIWYQSADFLLWLPPLLALFEFPNAYALFYRLVGKHKLSFKYSIWWTFFIVGGFLLLSPVILIMMSPRLFILAEILIATLQATLLQKFIDKNWQWILIRPASFLVGVSMLWHPGSLIFYFVESPLNVGVAASVGGLIKGIGIFHLFQNRKSRTPYTSGT